MHRAALVVLVSFLVACQSAPTPRHDSGGGAIGANATNTDDPNAGRVTEVDKDGNVVVVSRANRPANEATIKPEPIQLEPLKFDEIIQKEDRIVFLGDDMTQQGFYNRAFAAALMGMRPSYSLRFFNGGKDGATAASALEWADELLEMTKPTVVFICFGINDGKNLPPSDERMQAYEDSLTKLIEKVKAREGVREVVVMSAPASQTGDIAGGNKGGYNQTLYRMAIAAQGIAGISKVRFIDLYEPMRVVYTEAAKLGAAQPRLAQEAADAGGHMLTHGGRLPTEDGHTVVASVMLWAIGVNREMLEPVGWSPLKPPHMGRVRGALGIPLPVPEYRNAVICRQVYEKMREHDVYFFQAWRLARPNRPGRDRGQLMDQAASSWFELDSYVKSVYKDTAAATASASSDAPKTD